MRLEIQASLDREWVNRAGKSSFTRARASTLVEAKIWLFSTYKSHFIYFTSSLYKELIKIKKNISTMKTFQPDTTTSTTPPATTSMWQLQPTARNYFTLENALRFANE